MKTHKIIDSPLGPITLVNTDGVLSSIYFLGHRNNPARSSFGQETPLGFDQASEELWEYFAGERTEFTMPIAADGSGFEQKVWGLLRKIPYGATRSYGQLAVELGDKSLSRAVGVANARNPISVVVPCHRVIGADGSLIGYAAGLERKEFLLALENPDRAIAQPLF